MTTRREFVQWSAAGLAMAVCESAQSRTLREPSRSYEHGRPLREFHYGQVSLQPGLQETQLKQTQSVLMSLSEDSLLKPYRLRAGLPAPGCDLNGWYNTDAYGAETFGQWVSALSREYAISGNEATRAKVDRLVKGFAQTVEPTGKLFGDNKVTDGPAYHYDKLTCGLMDAHQFVRQPMALDVLAQATQSVSAHLPGKALDELGPEEGAHESYTLPENQFISWQRGGAEQHLAMAKQYLYHSFFDPLARGKNVLAGRHAYSHVNALCSAARAYLVLGEKKYLAAAVNGFAFVEAQSYATGGWGPNETFVPAPAIDYAGIPAIANLGDSLSQSHSHFETPCGAYAHIRLTRYLLRITRDPAYGDSMERVIYNTVLGAKPLLQDGRAFYHSDYHPQGHKEYFNGIGGLIPAEWPCCSGTLTQAAADYRINAYFGDEKGVYINLYIPSTVTWRQYGTEISLTQSGAYPLGDTVSLVLQTSRPTEFALRLRIPGWAKTPLVRVNGKSIASSIQPGTFATIEREWRAGDRIELELPRQLKLKAVDAQHPHTVALMDGPLALFALGGDILKPARQQLLAAQRKTRESAEWNVSTSEGLARMVPFWAIKNERYSLYLTVA